VAHRSVLDYQRALAPHGTYFFVGGSLGIIFQLLLFGTWIKNMRKKNLRLLAVQPNRNDLLSITQLCLAGKIIPVIDRTFPIRETPEALRYVGEGRSRGKIVIQVADENSINQKTGT
jgi:NADPH:quinone reductase-like Zn-dependent oxidoreductase